MIDFNRFNINWINNYSKNHGKADKILVEKVMHAFVSASKAAYLAAIIQTDAVTVDKYDITTGLNGIGMITDSEYSKLNKLRKTVPEAYFYFYQALKLFNIE